MSGIRELHIKLNKLCKANDELYHNYAVGIGLSDSALWTLYAIYEAENALTQNELCANWCYSKQTVNSTVKALENKGFVMLEHVEGTRVHKAIKLTDKGEDFCVRHIAPLIAAEEKALGYLSEEQRTAYYCLQEKEYELLKKELSEIETQGGAELAEQQI